MKNKIKIIILTLGLVSCSSNKIKSKKLFGLNTSLSKTFITKTDNSKTTIRNDSLLMLFDIYDVNLNNEVKIEFDNDNDFKINYKNKLGINEFRCFKGKFKKNYYQIFLEKKRISFPPIYSVVRINRLRISLTKDSILVINKYYNHSGMAYLFAAGSSSKSQYKFIKK